MMSGMRKPSPISISSPRLTMASPPRASSFRVSSTAAALLFTAIPGLPASRSRRSGNVRVALATASAGEIVFEIRIAFERRERRPMGARPRLVCRITPVALITRLSDGRASSAMLARTRLARLQCPWQYVFRRRRASGFASRRARAAFHSPSAPGERRHRSISRRLRRLKAVRAASRADFPGLAMDV